MTDLAVPQASALEERVHALVAEFAASWQRTLALAVELGQALAELKRELGHGAWLPWVESSFPLGRQMATNFMNVAANSQEIGNLPADTTLTAALAWLQSQRRLERAARGIGPRGNGLIIPPNCQIEVGDARQLRLDDESVQLVVTSPPYNARVVYDSYNDWLPWDHYLHGLLEPALREMFRVLAPGGRACINIANVVRQDVGERSGPPNVDWGRKWTPAGAGGHAWSTFVDRHLLPLLEDIGFLLRERLVWVKGNEPEDVISQSTAWGTWCSAENPVLRAVAEPVYVVSKGSFSREPGESDLDAEEFKAWTRNAWFIPTVLASDAWGNPAAFPVELPRRLIKLYSYPGDLVIDPFVGSGTTMVAAVRSGRWAYGCDISERYVAMARARVAAEIGA